MKLRNYLIVGGKARLTLDHIEQDGRPFARTFIRRWVKPEEEKG